MNRAKFERDEKNNRKITELVKQLAGDKLAAVLATAQQGLFEGKDWGRAHGDALQKHKCPNTFPDRDLN